VGDCAVCRRTRRAELRSVPAERCCLLLEVLLTLVWRQAGRSVQGGLWTGRDDARPGEWAELEQLLAVLLHAQLPELIQQGQTLLQLDGRPAPPALLSALALLEERSWSEDRGWRLLARHARRACWWCGRHRTSAAHPRANSCTRQCSPERRRQVCDERTSS